MSRPSPFYALDEVEAALDDRNLSRLLQVIGELGERSQLIVVTHQKRTMQIAETCTGCRCAVVCRRCFSADGGVARAAVARRACQTLPTRPDPAERPCLAASSQRLNLPMRAAHTREHTHPGERHMS